MGNIQKKMDANLEARKKNVADSRHVKTKHHIPGSMKKKGK